MQDNLAFPFTTL